MRLKDKKIGDRVEIIEKEPGPNKHGVILGFETNDNGTLFAKVQLDTRKPVSRFRATRKVVE